MFTRILAIVLICILTSIPFWHLLVNITVWESIAMMLILGFITYLVIHNAIVTLALPDLSDRRDKKRIDELEKRVSAGEKQTQILLSYVEEVPPEEG